MSLIENIIKLASDPKAAAAEVRQAVEQIASDPKAALDSAVVFVTDPQRIQSAVKPVTDLVSDPDKADMALDLAIAAVSLSKLKPGSKASTAHTAAAIVALQQIKKLNDKRRK